MLLKAPSAVLHDIIWVFKSPSLIAEGYFNVEDFQVNFDTGKSNVKLVANYLKNNPLIEIHQRRLGFYFEYLFEAGITLFSNHKVVLKNFCLPNQHNLGELDFITQSQSTRQFYHWEIAVKFYLGTGNQSRLENWVGPSKHDTFQKKWKKLLQKQLPFSNTPEVKHNLLEQGITISQKLLFVKGMLFYNLQSGNANFPDVVNPAHEKGIWLTPTHFLSYFDRNFDFRILPKNDWLTADTLKPELGILKMRKTFQQPLLRPIMFSFYKMGNYLGKGFLVPDGYF